MIPLAARLTAVLWEALRTSHPRLEQDGPRSQDIQKVLNACAAILDAFDPVRNKASLAHPNHELLGDAEAVLMLNVARTLLTYLDARLRQLVMFFRPVVIDVAEDQRRLIVESVSPETEPTAWRAWRGRLAAREGSR